MKKFTMIFTLLPLSLFGAEFLRNRLKCEPVDTKEKYLKCSNEKFYKLEQRSFNDPVVMRDTDINESNLYKEITTDSKTSPIGTSSAVSR